MVTIGSDLPASTLQLWRLTRRRPVITFVSKSGAKPIEDAYSRHYKWNQSAEKKRKAVEKAGEAGPEPAAAVDGGRAVRFQSGALGPPPLSFAFGGTWARQAGAKVLARR